MLIVIRRCLTDPCSARYDREWKKGESGQGEREKETERQAVRTTE